MLIQAAALQSHPADINFSKQSLVIGWYSPSMAFIDGLPQRNCHPLARNDTILVLERCQGSWLILHQTLHALAPACTGPSSDILCNSYQGSFSDQHRKGVIDNQTCIELRCRVLGAGNSTSSCQLPRLLTGKEAAWQSPNEGLCADMVMVITIHLQRLGISRK